MDLEKIKIALRKFAKERDWEQYHNPKNLATALSVEASELLEIFQWSNDSGFSEINDPKKRKKIEKEIADLFNYLLKLVDILKTELGRISKVEGKDAGDWVLIDTGDVIVHVFRPEVREFYQVEKMWTPMDQK